MVPGLLLNKLTTSPPIWGWQFGVFPDFGKVVTHPSNVFINTVLWTDDAGICSCSEMAPWDHPSTCKSTVLLPRASLRSLDFPIVPSVGQSSERCQYLTGMYTFEPVGIQEIKSNLCTHFKDACCSKKAQTYNDSHVQVQFMYLKPEFLLIKHQLKVHLMRHFKWRPSSFIWSVLLIRIIKTTEKLLESSFYLFNFTYIYP